MPEPLPPQDLEAEEYVLGAMMLASHAIKAVSEIIDAVDFYRDSHATIYRAALELCQHGHPVDPITLADKLDQNGELERVGGKERIREIATLVPAASNAGHHARIVRRMARLREQDELGRALCQSATNGGIEQDTALRKRLADILVDPRHNEVAELRFERLDEFTAGDEHAAETLIRVGAEETLLAADSLMEWFGDAGSGKTTLSLDLAMHAAAGIPWLGVFPVTRPLRVAILENEGSRGRFRLKLRRKRDTWMGAPIVDRIFVLAEPWGAFSFADEGSRAKLAAFVAEHEIDLLIAGPLAELGAKGAGTPDDVTEFGGLLADFRRRVGRPVAILLVHHENKSGHISGAWGRLPDTLVQVRADERERTRLLIRKARHSSRAHGAGLTLRWVRSCDGFEVIKSDLGDDSDERAHEEDEALNWLVNYVTEQLTATRTGVPRGKTETAFHEAHGNHGRNLARRVIDRQIALATTARADTASGETIRLAVGLGETAHGVYLYPGGDALSPPAATTNGDAGETGHLLDSRHSPPPLQEAARQREAGENLDAERDPPHGRVSETNSEARR